MPFLGWHYAAGQRQPYATLVGDYQRVIFLPGPLFGVIVLIGAAGFLIPRRRTAAAIVLWVSALIILVLPVAEHEYTYRYVIPAVPLACMAAALAFRHRGKGDEHETSTAELRPPGAELEPPATELEPPATELEPA
jgi:peptidoglycan/LPS O-acetylase OafA/YrhL